MFVCLDRELTARQCSPPGGLSLWLVVWLVLGKPSPASACPHLCVCYPTPMTVSCQAQNFTAVPVGVPYESQRVFLQNNRITELRVGSFGFGTQVKERNRERIKSKIRLKKYRCITYGNTRLNNMVTRQVEVLKYIFSIRFCGFSPTTSRGSRQGPSVS